MGQDTSEVTGPGCVPFGHPTFSWKELQRPSKSFTGEDHSECSVKMDWKRARAEAQKTLKVSTTQVWHDSLDQGDSNRVVISIRFWWYFEGIIFSYVLDIGLKRKRGVKESSKVWSLSHWKSGVAINWDWWRLGEVGLKKWGVGWNQEFYFVHISLRCLLNLSRDV